MTGKKTCRSHASAYGPVYHNVNSRAKRRQSDTIQVMWKEGEEGRIAKGGMQLTRQQLKSTYRNKKDRVSQKITDTA
jgi:hypothetical protein